jgi:hypothetical protein
LRPGRRWRRPGSRRIRRQSEERDGENEEQHAEKELLGRVHVWTATPRCLERMDRFVGVK